MIRLAALALFALASPGWAGGPMFDPMKLVSDGSDGEDIVLQLTRQFKTVPEIKYYDSPDILKPTPSGAMTSLAFYKNGSDGKPVPYFLICGGELVAFSAPMTIDETPKRFAKNPPQVFWDNAMQHTEIAAFREQLMSQVFHETL